MYLLNSERIVEWTEKVGGVSMATGLILQATGLMPSTAEKIAKGTYPSQPNFLVRKALVELTGIPQNELFDRKRDEAAS
jgi:hypothetical protein